VNGWRRLAARTIAVMLAAGTGAVALGQLDVPAARAVQASNVKFRVTTTTTTAPPSSSTSSTTVPVGAPQTGTRAESRNSGLPWGLGFALLGAGLVFVTVGLGRRRLASSRRLPPDGRSP
jgi:hypothetical protein